MFTLEEQLQKKIDENFTNTNTYKFSDHDISKFGLLFWKGFYPYEYMGDWEKINETLLQ